MILIFSHKGTCHDIESKSKIINPPEPICLAGVAFRRTHKKLPLLLNWFVAPTLIPIVSAVQNQLAHQKYNLHNNYVFIFVG